MSTYIITPRKEQLESLQRYFKEEMKKQNHEQPGYVAFTYQGIMDAEPGKYLKSMSYISTLLNFLADKGLATRIRKGHSAQPNLWDVSKFLEEGVPEGMASISDPIGPRGSVIAVENGKPKHQMKIEVAKPEAPVVQEEQMEMKAEVEEPADQSAPEQNKEAIANLQGSIREMIGFVESLPKDITSELRALSDSLTLADPAIVDELKKENERLQGELKYTREQLEEAVKNASPNYSEHYIYRQRNLILDDVNRIMTSPAWSIRQNKNHYVNSITTKLDNMMKELKIQED